MSVLCLFVLKTRDSSDRRSAVLDSLTPWQTSVAAMSQHVPTESPAAAAAPEGQGGAGAVADAVAVTAPAVADQGVPPAPETQHQKRHFAVPWSHTE